jgi:hypothetical protein
MLIEQPYKLNCDESQFILKIDLLLKQYWNLTIQLLSKGMAVFNLSLETSFLLLESGNESLQIGFICYQDVYLLYIDIDCRC